MSAAANAGVAAIALVVLLAAATWGMVRRPAVTTRRAAPQPTSWRRRVGGVVVAGIAVVVVAGPLAAVAVATIGVIAYWWRLRRARQRCQRAVSDGYPDAIDLVVLGIRAGLLPAAALASAAPHLPVELAPAFADVRARTQRGERFADALAALTDGLGEPARPMVDSLAAAERYGLPIAPVLERLADEARADRRRAADAAARQLPVRLAAPLVVCTLPSFVLLAIVPLLVGAFSSWHLP